MALLLGKAKLSGSAQTTATARVTALAASALGASADLVLQARVVVQAAALFQAVAEVSTESVIPSVTTAIRFVTHDPLGSPLAGTIRVDQRVVGALDLSLYVPLRAEVETAGDITLNIPTGIEADYYFTPRGEHLAHFAGRLSATAPGNFGELLRAQAGQVIGSQTYRSVRGYMFGRNGKPSSLPRLTLNSLGVAKDGSLIVPIPTAISLDYGGHYDLSLAETGELYTSAGSDVLMRALDGKGKRIGAGDFVVPAKDNLRFRVVNNTLELYSFLPTNLTGLQAWLDASALTGLSDNDQIATMPDLSGEGNDFTQINSIQRPVYKADILNNLAVMRFDGADDRLEATATDFQRSGTDELTIAVLVRSRTIDNLACSVFSARYENHNYMLRGLSSDLHLHGPTQFLSGYAHPVNSWALVVARVTNSPSFRSIIRVNRALVQTNTSFSYGLSANTKVTIGGNPLDIPGPYDIAELQWYSRGLTDSEITELEDYYANKWGV